MVNNYPHPTSAAPLPSGPRRRIAPRWDFWALTVLAAPVATGLGLAALNAWCSTQESVEVALVVFGVVGALAGALAPSGRVLHPAARVLWSLLGAALSAGVPVALVVGFIYALCHGGGCFS